MGHAGSMSIWMGELSFMKTSQDRIAASAKSQELVVFSIASSEGFVGDLGLSAGVE